MVTHWNWSSCRIERVILDLDSEIGCCVWILTVELGVASGSGQWDVGNRQWRGIVVRPGLHGQLDVGFGLLFFLEICVLLNFM